MVITVGRQYGSGGREIGTALANKLGIAYYDEKYFGMLNKFYSENCLLQQEFVRGDVFTGTVEQYIADAAKKLGGKIDFVDAVRFEKGEGIEKKQENFAEEIASMIKG